MRPTSLLTNIKALEQRLEYNENLKEQKATKELFRSQKRMREQTKKMQD